LYQPLQARTCPPVLYQPLQTSVLYRPLQAQVQYYIGLCRLQYCISLCRHRVPVLYRPLQAHCTLFQLGRSNEPSHRLCLALSRPPIICTSIVCSSIACPSTVRSPLLLPRLPVFPACPVGLVRLFVVGTFVWLVDVLWWVVAIIYRRSGSCPVLPNTTSCTFFYPPPSL
jgi:hypothetical protein